MAQNEEVCDGTLSEAFADAYAFFSSRLSPRGARLFLDVETVDEAHKVGKREGLYAKLFLRRERLAAVIGSHVTTYTSRFASLVDLTAITKVVRKQTEATVTQHRAVRDAILALLLRKLQDTPEEANTLHALILGILVAARAEGITAGKAIVAAKHGGNQPTLDDLYTETVKYVNAHSGTLSARTTTAQAAVVGGIAGDVARSLPTTNTTAEDVLAAGAGAALYLDHAAHQAYTTGMATTYRQAGTYKVDFVTVGDGRVCVTCLDAEASSPYNIDDAPEPPLHINCRCWIAPADTSGE